MSIKVGLIGQGISASRSPAMHEAEGRRQGLDLCYDRFDTEDDHRSLSELLDAAQADGYAGLNITHPFKQSVIGLLDQTSDAARQIGSVNTVVFDGTKRIGHNTDCPGFAQGFGEGLADAALETVTLVGAGGAGLAVGFALRDLGVQNLLIVDRDQGMAQTLAARLGTIAKAVPDMSHPTQGFVNATPMGMASYPGSAIPSDILTQDHWVADIVYFPLETELLRHARALGCATLSGAGMAVHQAALSFELFTGQKADATQMRATFEAFKN